jgi:acetyltransferase
LLFGQGGTAAEVVKDRTIGLPPLNSVLARDMISRTRIAKLLDGYRDRPPADIDALAGVLVQLSQMLVDLAEISEIDINPLLVDSRGLVALDARIRLAPAAPGERAARLAIRPYPRELEEAAYVDGAPILIRPIRPEDEPAHRELLAGIDPEDIRLRFFGYRRQFSHEDLARWTQIDYDREMAFIATIQNADGLPRTLGVVRSIVDPDNTSAEFAILVDSRIKRRGLGRRLMTKMIGYLRGRGTRKIEGQILLENEAMLRLVTTLGFTIRPLDGIAMSATLDLT